jgi:NTE family protein
MEPEAPRANSFEGVAFPIAALEGVRLLEGLGAQELVGVASVMRFRSFEAGSVILREGQPGESMFVIVDGLVHLLASLAEEPLVRTRSIFDEGRLVGKLRPGDVVGSGALISGEPHSATAKAAVDTNLLELGRDDFRALIGTYPRVLENLTAILTRRLAEATSQRARGKARGEAVALVAAPSLEEGVRDVLTATAAASPRPVGNLDARSGLADALERLDPLLREHGTVVVVAALDGEELPQLLPHVDRAVAVIGEQAELERLAAIAQQHAVKGQPVEVALAEGLALPELAGDAVRLVRAMPSAGGGLPGPEAAWLGRHLSRTKLGLALGAGGAKGYAHIGTLHALEDAGYQIDCVGGSSIGAIVATWIALGMRAEEIESAMREMFTPQTVAETLKISLSGQASGHETMVRLLRELSDGRTFADCVMPLAIMTADLTDKRPAPIREGPLDEALIAATALAGVFPPHELAGHRLVDGLAIDPVPTAAVIEDGADVTVSVNLIPRETLPAWPGQEPPPPLAARQRGSRMLDTLLEVMDLAQLDASEQGAGLADVPITPSFGPGSWKEFELADLFLAAGRDAAEERLPALRALAKPQFAGVTQ